MQEPIFMPLCVSKKLWPGKYIKYIRNSVCPPWSKGELDYLILIFSHISKYVGGLPKRKL